MPPPANEKDDLPAGIHPATLDEMAARYGAGSAAPSRALLRLRHVHEPAARTGRLQRFSVLGSFVSTAAEPRDIEPGPKQTSPV